VKGEGRGELVVPELFEWNGLCDRCRGVLSPGEVLGIGCGWTMGYGLGQRRTEVEGEVGAA